MEKKFFIIQSYGRTATQWFADLLNADPDVFCTHNYDISFLYTDPIPPTFIHNHVIAPLFRLIDPEKHLIGMAAQTECPYVGNIHGMDAIKFSQRNSRLEPDIAYAIITRHPIDRIGSYVERWIYECSEPGAEFIRDNYLRDSARIVSDHPELLNGMDVTSQRDRLFVNALFATHPTDAIELESELPIFKLEDITGSQESLQDFCLHVFQGDEAVAARVAANWGNERKRDSRSTVTGTEAILASWSDWQCHAFNYLFANDETRRRYQNHGYRVDFDRWQSRFGSS